MITTLLEIRKITLVIPKYYSDKFPGPMTVCRGLRFFCPDVGVAAHAKTGQKLDFRE